MKTKIIYIGTSHTIIESLTHYSAFELSTIICEEKRITYEYKKTIQRLKLNLIPFTTKLDFEKIIETFKPEEFVFIIYQLDLIVPAHLANNYHFFNLHAGSIKTNRGAHPIIWSILNGDTSTELTFHKINEKIDQGIIIGKYSVPIHQKDDATSIKRKMETGLPMLFNSLNLFLKGDINGEICNAGIYRKPIQEKDYTINVFVDNRALIENKIKSQKQYKGAIVWFNNVKYNVTKLLEWNEVITYTEKIVIHENKIEIQRMNDVFTLELFK